MFCVHSGPLAAFSGIQGRRPAATQAAPQTLLACACWRASWLPRWVTWALSLQSYQRGWLGLHKFRCTQRLAVRAESG